MLEVAHVSHGFVGKDNSHYVLKDVSFNIKKGEIFSIVGPSGCGKTTLVNIITGYIKPLSGEIRINSRSVVGPGRDRVLVNQENDLFEWLTVQQNLSLVSNNANFIDRMLGMVHLNSYKHLYPHQLSGGMKKRLSLIRGLLVEPKVLILDEPFSSLDFQLKNELYKDLMNLFRDIQCSVIIVSHDIEESILLSHRVCVLGQRKYGFVDTGSVVFPLDLDGSVKFSEELICARNKVESLFYSMNGTGNLLSDATMVV